MGYSHVYMALPVLKYLIRPLPRSVSDKSNIQHITQTTTLLDFLLISIKDVKFYDIIS